MSQGITLYGAEDVARAGSTIQSAADQMTRAENSMEECTRRLELLFGQGYGTNIDHLIESLNNLTAKLP